MNTDNLFLASGKPLVLFFAAFVAGALNSVAGGGSFISFPALLFTRVAPIAANATSTVALWPGTVASTIAYRRELAPEVRRTILPLVASTMLGGLLGAQILLHTPQATFQRLIPWLLLGATVLFATSDRVTRWIRARQPQSDRQGGSRIMTVGVLISQLVIAAYIGYFGSGSGIMILALLSILGKTDIHAMNGIKTLLVSVGNLVAMISFIAAKVVMWPQASLMLVGAALGGYGGAVYARKMNQQQVRRLVIGVGFLMSFYFFVRN